MKKIATIVLLTYPFILTTSEPFKKTKPPRPKIPITVRERKFPELTEENLKKFEQKVFDRPTYTPSTETQCLGSPISSSSSTSSTYDNYQQFSLYAKPQCNPPESPYQDPESFCVLVALIEYLFKRYL